MSQIRNHFTCAAPVHKLPTEILYSIFHLVHASVNRCHSRSFTGGDLPEYPVRYPDCLAHVCCRWRKIALSLPSLWTHVDLTTDISIGEGFLDRARAYAERARSMLLEIHLDDKGCACGKDYYALAGIIQHLASRVQGMEFVITAPKLLDFHGSVMNSLFPGISSKVFKNLRMSSEASLPGPFLWGRDNWAASDEHDLGPNILKCTNDVIDTGFSGVTSLHLRGIFFDWSRGLYHGLVDLRLSPSPTGRVPFITAFTLVAVLSKSPGLRIFQFSLNLSAPDDPDDTLSPVSLPDLEVVQISTARAWSCASSLFQLLKPGSKPLRLTLETGPYENLVDQGGINEFFARSKVEKLCIRDGNLSMNELRRCDLPYLKVLVFDSCDRILIEPVPTSPSKWNSCMIHATKLDMYQLRSIFKLCPTGLTVSRCEVRRWLRNEEHELVVPEAELRAAFPNVQFGDSQLDPTAGWDILE
ncbi:hypothetical protein B0J17DRAFT_709628 [Rhizoctonia solani]|nr:hypothetical protein B0J17DRAFT_709628 [Rhizoctonia solani]